MTKIALKISSLTLGLFFVVPTHIYAEVIKSFDSQIVVNTENSITVNETIVYDSEGLEKHGIFRDITPKSSEGKIVNIKNISVTDPDGNTYQWQKQNNNGDVRLKIGDPDVTFSGQKAYIIRYTATDTIAHLDNSLDEIYWNATGNNWPFNIEKVTVSVILPSGANLKQSACYQGIVGSKDSCNIGNLGMDFESAGRLLSGEGVTIAVGFPSGFVSDPVPTATEKFMKKFGVFWPVLIPLLTFIFMFQKWYRKGRDPKDSGVIVPQYDVPDGLTPMEVGIIVYEKSRTKDISAELIYLATKGYIKIRQTNEKILGLINNKKYELVRLKESKDLQNDFDKKLLDRIFAITPIGESIDLGSLANTFYKTIPVIFQSIREGVLTKQYYKYLPKVKISPSAIAFIIPVFYFVAFSLSFFRANFSGATMRPGFFLLLPMSIIVTMVTFALFKRIMPAKTEKGVQTKDYILGLKQYLQIAEKDRLNFHNAPSKKPEVFEQLLPYAMVLGVERAWAKEFKDIYTTPPSWYEGSQSGTFNALVFSSSLSHFSAFASSSLTSSPRSSGGSGGGGSSGGGGGGGGGGSW